MVDEVAADSRACSRVEERDVGGRRPRADPGPRATARDRARSGTGDARGSAAGRRRPASSSPPADLAQRAGQGVDHVGQAAGLGPRLAFGGDRSRRASAARIGRGGGLHGPPTCARGELPLNRFTRASGGRYDPRAGAHRSHPLGPAEPRPRAAAARGPAASRLQPLLDLAPAARAASSRASTRAPWARYRSPIPVLPGIATGRRSSTTPTSWPSTAPGHRRVRPLHGQRRRPLVPAPATRASSTGPIAYFCAEYGLHESLGIYSGGLGVLAGDHLKAACDMALPFVGVGLLYRHGYFRQTIDADGHQEHALPGLRPARLPHPRARTGMAIRSPSPSSCPAGPSRSPSGSPRSAACRCCCSTPTSPTTTRRTGRSPTSCTCAAARCACTRSWSWASAACGRCGRWASSPRRGTSTRATRRSCSSSGRASWSPPATTLDDGARHGPTQRVFTIHTPVSAGNERFDADLVRRVAGAAPRRRRAAEHRGCRSSACSSSGAARTTTRPVRHDRLLAAPHQRRQRGQPAPRRDRQRDLAGHRSARPSWASPTASTRRRGSAGRSASCSSATSAPTSTTSTTDAATRCLGAHRPHPRRAAVGGAPASRSWSWRSSRAAGCGSSSRATARRRASSQELAEALDPAS